MLNIMENKNKFKEFLSVGAVALAGTLVVGSIVGLASHGNELKAEKSAAFNCLMDVSATQKFAYSAPRISNPQNQEETDYVARQEAHKTELKAVNLNTSKCDVLEMRAKMLEKIKEVNDKHNKIQRAHYGK